MARVNVYLPERLAREWRLAGLDINISRITQFALERELARWKNDGWLGRVAVQRVSGISHRETLAALTDAATVAGADPM